MRRSGTCLRLAGKPVRQLKGPLAPAMRRARRRGKLGFLLEASLDKADAPGFSSTPVHEASLGGERPLIGRNQAYVRLTRFVSDFQHTAQTMERWIIRRITALPVVIQLLGLMLVTSSACASILTLAQDGGSQTAFVVIDRREAAFTVFTGVSKDTPNEQLNKIRADVANQSGTSMVTWSEFRATANEFAKSTMLRSDYPNYRVVEGIVCLVGKQPGVPWGLTWNGGIALTFRDYEHARRTYRLFKENPAQYRPTRDPRADPVNPGGFLPAFGCS